MDNPTKVLHQLHSSFLRLLTAAISPNDGPATGAISVSGRRYFRFLSGGKPRAFRVNIRADSYLGPILPGLRAEGHTRGFGLCDHFRSGYFRFRWVQGVAAGRRHDSRLASGSDKSRFFHVESAYFTENIPNYTEYWKITPNLITD